MRVKKNKQIFIDTTKKQKFEIFNQVCKILKIEYGSFWFYLETKKEKIKFIESKFNNLYQTNKKIKPVTTYDNSANSDFCKNKIYRLNDNFLKKINKFYKRLYQSCDSVCGYISSYDEWIVCQIMHENILIVNDINNISKILRDKKISFSHKPPQWF